MDALTEKLKEPQFHGLSDQEAADAINLLTVTKVRLVPRKEILKVATTRGFYGHIIVDIDNLALPVEHRVALLNIKGWIDNAANGSEYADLESETSIEMIGNLLRYRRQGIATNPTYISTTIAQELNSLKFETVRWVDHNGVGTLGRGVVYNARLEIARGA